MKSSAQFSRVTPNLHCPSPEEKKNVALIFFLTQNAHAKPDFLPTIDHKGGHKNHETAKPN